MGNQTQESPGELESLPRQLTIHTDKVTKGWGERVTRRNQGYEENMLSQLSHQEGKTTLILSKRNAASFST